MKVAIVKLTDIRFGTRFREEMGDLDGLAESIRTKGLITPLAVSHNADSTLSEPYVLLAGGRRYEACRLANLAEIPVRIYDRELSELELRSIELEENIQRKDLNWIETVKLQREIHTLQMLIHGGEKISTAPDAPGWSQRDTAKLIGRSNAAVSTDLKLAEAVESRPDIEWEKCKNKHEAVKLLTKAEEAVLRQELARRVESASAGKESMLARLGQSYMIGDFLKSSESLTPGTFNLVEVDPPYGIDLGRLKRKDRIGPYHFGENGYNEIDAQDYLPFLSSVMKRCYELMSQHSWLVWWFGPDPWFEPVYSSLLATGFSATRLCGLWVKPNGQTNQPETRLANAYEMFFLASKGSPYLVRPGRTNVFAYSPVPPQHKYHPTERPLELMQDIFSTLAVENSRVLVPFAGSGVSLIAAHTLKMHSIGYDLSEPFRDGFLVKIHTTLC